MKIRTDLIPKYDVPVPRYTSYPPANFFSSDLKAEHYESLIKASNHDNPQSIAFYIHIPFCKKICYYCGCNSCSLGQGLQVEPYIEALKQEIEMVTQKLAPNRRVSQIHYGGGTPNAIAPQIIAELNALLFSKFKFTSTPEIAIECHPAYMDHHTMDVLLDAGFNRFSLGIQDFDTKVLKTVNRDAAIMPPEEIMAYLKNKGKNISVNFDFIYGLPGQTVESFANTMKLAAKIKPDRLVTFSYAHVPWVKKQQKILEKKGLPSPDTKLKMFQSTFDIMEEAGYKPIGLDHFVLPTDELYRSLQDQNLHRNFQGYCTRKTTGQVYAFGVSAISQLEKAYIQNTKNIDTYIEQIKNNIFPVERGYILSEEQIIIRETITGLMCNKRLRWQELAQHLNITQEKLKNCLVIDESSFKQFAEDGLIEYDNEGIDIKEDGVMFMRNIAASMDKNYNKNATNYSKSV